LSYSSKNKQKDKQKLRQTDKYGEYITPPKVAEVIILRNVITTRAVQPVATCRQSPYLHKPVIVIGTSFSLWRLAHTALAALTAPFTLWRYSHCDVIRYWAGDAQRYGCTYLTAFNIHCVSKNVPPLTFYNLYIHGSIATIFGTNVAEKVGNQNILYFLTSPN